MQPINPLTVQLDMGGVWRISFFVGIALALVKDAWCESKSWTIRALWAYVLLSALFIVEYPALTFGPYHVAFQATAGAAMIEIIFISLAVYQFEKTIKKLIPYFAAFAALCTWMEWPGLLHAPAFHTAAACACIPFIPWWLALGVIITALAHHGSTAILILSAQLLAVLLSWWGKPKRAWALAFAVLAAFFYSAYTHSGALFDGGERLAKYREYFEFWQKEWKWIVFGVGPGSFVHIGMMLDGYKPPYFLQMHSDWLQILWENGAIGFGLVLLTWFSAVKTAWRSPELRAALFGVAAFGLTYHPLRFFPTSVLTAWIVFQAISYKSDSPEARPSNSSG